jgi:hypothetical protein
MTATGGSVLLCEMWRRAIVGHEGQAGAVGGGLHDEILIVQNEPLTAIAADSSPCVHFSLNRFASPSSSASRPMSKW